MAVCWVGSWRGRAGATEPRPERSTDADEMADPRLLASLDLMRRMPPSRMETSLEGAHMHTRLSGGAAPATLTSHRILVRAKLWSTSDHTAVASAQTAFSHSLLHTGHWGHWHCAHRTRASLTP